MFFSFFWPTGNKWQMESQPPQDSVMGWENTEPAQTPFAHARSQPLKQATWRGQSKTTRLWGNVSDADWGMWRRPLLDLQIGCAGHDSLAFEADTVSNWQGCHCSSGRLQGFTGSQFKRRQIVQELFAWIFNTAAVCTIKHPDIWVTLGSRSHAYTFKDVSNYRSVQW